MSSAASAGEAPRLGFPTKLAYAVGSTATNLKLRALSTFLVIFYNQVVGLPPTVVGGILGIALALSLRTEWKRRRAARIPAAKPIR